MSILDKISKDHLREYLEKCSAFVDIDVDAAINLTNQFIKKHRGENVLYEDVKHMVDLETQWYASLSVNTPDYSVYADPYYYCEVWLCWKNYSRRYLKEISSKKSLFTKSIVDDMDSVKAVVDLGCGFGYTTIGLKEIFPSAKVYGTNLKDTPQYSIAKTYETENDILIIDDYTKLDTDLIFASEYFEHFENPIEHLTDVLQNTNPRYMLIANTFNGKAIGHFNSYGHNNKKYDGKTISKMFNDTLRQHGYEKIETNCWNNRPNYWKKIQGNTLERYL